MIEIELTRGLTGYIDDIDTDLAALKWSADAKGYAQRQVSKTTVKLHRVVMMRKLGRLLLDSEQVDHRNRNKSDNRRDNLRLATHEQNSQNQDRKGKSKGVAFVKKRPTSPGRWRARIRSNGQLYHLGYFTSKDDAIAAYNEAARRLFGEFAALSS